MLSIGYGLVLGELETPAMVRTIEVASGQTDPSDEPTSASFGFRRLSCWIVRAGRRRR